MILSKQVDDGVIDGKMTIDATTRRLQFQQASIPPATFRKIGGD